MYTFHALNESDSNSASTKGSLPKKIKKTKYKSNMGETLQALRKGTNQKQDNLFGSFGKHIANKVRSLDNENTQRWVKFKMQEIIAHAQCNPQVQMQMKNSIMADLITQRTASQKICCPVFPHPI